MIKLQRQHNQLENTLSTLLLQQEKLKLEINQLQTNNEYIEKIAREKFMMVIPGEKIYRVKNEKIIKKYHIKDFLDKSLIIRLDILSKDLNLGEKKIYFKIKNNNTYKIENLQIKAIFTNRYLLKDFQIIDKIDNCYYVE